MIVITNYFFNNITNYVIPAQAGIQIIEISSGYRRKVSPMGLLSQVWQIESVSLSN